MNEHVPWESLNDYADNTLAPQARAAAARHLDSCADCREQLAGLRRLIASASDAVENIEPPAEVWRALRRELEGRGAGVASRGVREHQRDLPLHPGSAIPSPTQAGPRDGARGVRAPVDAWWRRPAALAAAAAILVVLSSLITARIVSRAPAASVAAGSRPGDSLASPVSFPADMARAERDYRRTIDELDATLQEERSRLAPATVAAVERSLSIIDAAIAEARDALRRDPANAMLRDVFTRNYQQKLDLLRRAASLAQQS
jgi:hypothetical protein